MPSKKLHDSVHHKLSPKAFALSIGIVFAICIFILAIMASFDWGNTMLLEIQSVYIGYKPGLIGGIIGAVWAFVDGLITGYLVAYFYNKFV